MATFVKKFSQQMKTIEESIQSLNVKVVGLNHVERKSSRYNHDGDYLTKGVDSDFVKIFQIGVGLNFAFSFFFNKVDEPYIVASFKQNSKITSSANYKEESFKKNLNQFVKLLKILKTADSLTSKSVISTFISTFLDGYEFNEREAISSVIAAVTPEIKKLKLKYDSKIKEKENTSKTVSSKKLKIKKAVDNVKKELNIDCLKQKYDEALSMVWALEEKLKKEAKLSNYEKKEYQLNISINEYNREVELALSKALQNVPKDYRKSIRDQLKNIL
jgi:hypothetical protein